ncbi:MAG TPA: helix-turn-helix domain-containing protein [Terriglobia bacterium]|nr:helix-turn-helix domain-containing protein [Terriglobia bacterium]
MAKHRALSEDELQQLKTAMRAARTPAELRRLQCVWLPEALGVSAADTARALGWRAQSVHAVLKRHKRFGVSALRDHGVRPLPPGSAKALRTALRRAGSLEEFRLIQCVALRASLGLDASQVVEAVGWSRGAVGRVQSDYVRLGAAALVPAGAEPLAEGFANRLRGAMKNARNVPEFRRAQCVYMRVVQGLSTSRVAGILGWTRNTVTHLHHLYLRHGEAVLRGPGRGGARRRQPLTRKQEDAVLRKLGRERYDYGFLMYPVIHRAFEEAAGCPLTTAYVVSVLQRHGWMIAAVVTVHRRKYRPQDVEGWHIGPDHPSRRRSAPRVSEVNPSGVAAGGATAIRR